MVLGRTGNKENGKQKKLDAGWPESEEGQVGNVKLEEEVKRRSNEDNLVK